jgi:hypothetical protein
MLCDLASIVLQARYIGSSGSFVDDYRTKQIRVRRKPQSEWFSRPCMRIVVLNVGIWRSGSQENKEAGCISKIPAARGARDLQKLKGVPSHYASSLYLLEVASIVTRLQQGQS